MKLTSTLLPLMGALTLAFAGQAYGQEQKVVIGMTGPLSGSNAFAGKDNENGVRLAIEDLNSKKITVGGKTLKFELQSEDDQCDPRAGVMVAQKLVDSNVKFVMGPYCSGVAVPASRLYDQGGAMMSTVGTNPKVTQGGFKNLFRIIASDNQIGASMAAYASNVLKLKTVAVIDDRTAFGQGVAEEFTKEATKLGLTVLAKEFTTDKATDFTAILTSLKAKKPDVIFFGGMDAVAGPMMRQMKQLGIEAKFMGGDGICTGELPKLAAGTMADGQVVCAEAGGVEGTAKKSMEDFYAAYKKKYNMDVQVYAPYVYDAVNVMVAAMVKAGSAEPAKYLPVLAKIEHKGVTGNIAFDAKGDIRNGALTLYTYKGGKREQIAVVR